MKPNYIFETEMEVRDYECDIQGIVNNANYLHYTEHTRHLYLTSLGVSFARLHEKGVDAVVARMNLQYKTPLRCDDVFVSKLGVRKEGLRYIFDHAIHRKSDGRLCFLATVELVSLINGKPGVSGCNNGSFFVAKQYRHTVSGHHDARNTGGSRKFGVCLFFSVVVFCPDDSRRMNLAEPLGFGA